MMINNYDLYIYALISVTISSNHKKFFTPLKPFYGSTPGDVTINWKFMFDTL